MARTQTRRVCVYCASSRVCDESYHREAFELGALMARAGIEVVYGGGNVGSMGALADGALKAGGRVIGVLPRFMYDLEWGHRGLTELRLVNDMHERKRMMIADVDAVIALPGGCGTFEELFEAMSWKRLGLYVGPIVIVNSNGFYDPALALLERSVAERFMDRRHARMWTVVARVSEVPAAILSAPEWDASYRSFAVQ